MNYKYDSSDAMKLIDDVMKVKMEAELNASIDLAHIISPFDGCSYRHEYPNGEPANDFYKFIKDTYPELHNRMKEYGRRNVNWSTIAPAGSVSILAQSTSGCEPLFSPYYVRRVKINPNDTNKSVDFIDDNGDSWQNNIVIHPKIKQLVILNGGNINSINDVERIYKESSYYKSTANDINWIKRVEIQSILQKYTTSAISTTLNLPNDVKEEDVYKIYIKSWEMGLKGQTIYRDGCRTGVLIKEDVKCDGSNIQKRPKDLEADVYIASAKGDKYIIAVGKLNGKPFEVFGGHANGFGIKKTAQGILTKHKKGQYGLVIGDIEIDDFSKHFTPVENTIFRLISSNLKYGIPLELSNY
jgi:ribonucleoside-diphosphate reductase alpha chain